ncbi:MAG TPA: carboxypeptidase regulatory-like domain-containing protein [Bryobacteraceae bacterium]|nr:carboxypeptidase regulatory-like domain-containing protein [Bryobacteraceae bacterium]
MNTTIRLAVLTLFLTSSLATPLAGQTGSAGVAGTIADQTGALIPGVYIKVINEDSGTTVETTSVGNGHFRVTSLLPGRYRIEAASRGFENLVRKGVVIATGQTVALELVLTIGASTGTVTVEEASPLAETQSQSVGQLINRRMVAGLPMPNRAASSLVALAPGVVMIDPGQGAENYPVFSVAGGRARNQNFTLDGGNATNASGLTRVMQMTSLPMDAMQEFRVISNNYSAEHGHSAGGVIALTTRSGTNEWRGSAFEFLRNSVLDARNFFARERPPLRLNQYGFALGGPIRKDKTHFFASLEHTQQVSSITPLQTVPSEAQRAGDFSGLQNTAGNPILVYDPATTLGALRQPFPGNRIPLHRFDPVASAALRYWPAPNRTATATGANNYSGNANSDLSRNIFVARFDHQLRQSDQFTARYYLNDAGIQNNGSFGIPESDPNANFTGVRVQSLLGSQTHIFSPSLVNDIKVTFFQRRFIDKRFGWEEDLAGTLGLSGVSKTAFPNFAIPGYVALSAPPGRVQTPIRDTQILDALSWFGGGHSLKVGFEFRRSGNSEIRDRGSSGIFQFLPQYTSLPGTPGTGDGFATFLLGEANSANIQISDKIRTRAYYLAGYVQDDWRVTSRLTINLGLRWETELPRRSTDNSQNSFDLARINPVSGTPGVVTFSGRDGTPVNAFRTDWNNFGPRVGLAYRLPFRRETVIRMGFGAFYGSTVSNTIGDTASTGFSTSAALVVPQAEFLSALALRHGFPFVTRPPLNDSFGAVPAGQRSNLSVGFFKQDQVSPTSFQYNFNIQREVTAQAVLEVGYMANVSHHLAANDLTLNQVAPQRLGPGDSQARRPFPQFSNVTWINPSIGDSSFHSAYVRLERRFHNGLSLLTHYTFSKFIDDVASADEYGDPGSYMDAYNRRLDKSLSGSDIPHRVVMMGLYQAPSLKGRPLLRWLAGSWQLGVLTTLQSGPPFTAVMAANTTNAFSAGPLRPNLLRDPRLAGAGRTLARWFDTLAFNAPPQFRFGNSPRSGLRGDASQTVDATLSKELPVTERFQLGVRAELYNLLNHANFELPGHVLGAADFGSVLSAKASRAIQLGLRLSF